MKKWFLALAIIILILISGCVDKCSEDSECDDGNACTEDTCEGQPKECRSTAITTCRNNDNCCPSNCSYANDNDCPECTLGADCDNGNPCTVGACVDGSCAQTAVSECSNNDSCCPSNCSYANDNDCPECTTSIDCEDNNPCTEDKCLGTPGRCSNELKTACQQDDGCCPTGCTSTNDNDCISDQSCDDLGGEICAVNERCTTGFVSASDSARCCLTECVFECSNDSDCDDDDKCTEDKCENGECEHPDITACQNNDGCCPSGCINAEDNDCPECTTDMECEDKNPCTQYVCSSGTCTLDSEIIECSDGDGCCPPGCEGGLGTLDSDCKAQLFATYEGDTIRGLKGTGDYEGQDLYIKVRSIVKPDIHYACRLELYQSDETLINNATVDDRSARDSVNEYFYDSGYQLKTILYLKQVQVNPITSVGYCEFETYTSKDYNPIEVEEGDISGLDCRMHPFTVYEEETIKGLKGAGDYDGQDVSIKVGAIANPPYPYDARLELYDSQESLIWQETVSAPPKADVNEAFYDYTESKPRLETLFYLKDIQIDLATSASYGEFETCVSDGQSPPTIE